MPWRVSPAEASPASKTLPPGISAGITPSELQSLWGNPYLGWSQNRPTVSRHLPLSVHTRAQPGTDSNKGNNHEDAYDEGTRLGLRVAGSVGSYLE